MRDIEIFAMRLLKYTSYLTVQWTINSCSQSIVAGALPFLSPDDWCFRTSSRGFVSITFFSLKRSRSISIPWQAVKKMCIESTYRSNRIRDLRMLEISFTRRTRLVVAYSYNYIVLLAQLKVQTYTIHFYELLPTWTIL